jgi:aspartyl-tRNA(Asn)/glutamyl-tRNA(Gln) amidotransferase subunit C
MSDAMSESSIETVRKVAALARLDIDAGEAHELGLQFGRILEHFQLLARLDVEGVEPMLSAAAGANVLREDLPRPGLNPEEALGGAPERAGEFYRVPKTVGGEE